MKSNSTIDQPENLHQPKINKLRKLGIFASFYFSLILLILSYYIFPEIFDGSLYKVLLSNKGLPDSVFYSLISYGTTIVALVGAIMLLREKENGLYFFLIGDGIWLLLWIMSIAFERLNIISLFNSLFALIFLILAVGQLKNSRLDT